MQVMGPQERLDYPTAPLEMSNGCVVERYLIPDEDRTRVLEALYPFQDVPPLDAVCIDIHTNKPFTVRDFLVIREGDLNFLAAPRYAEAGGTVLDWIPMDEADGGGERGGVVSIRPVRKSACAATP